MRLSRGRPGHELTVVQLARTPCTGDSGSSPGCLSDVILTPVIGTNNRFRMMKLEAIGCLGVERPPCSRALLGCHVGSNPAAETDFAKTSGQPNRRDAILGTCWNRHTKST